MVTINISGRNLVIGGVAAAAVLFKLWLVDVQDMLIMASPMDDLFFVRSANELLSGRWLGAYNHYTLMTGPVYSMWIALCYLLIIPLHKGQLFLYATACAVAMYSLHPLVRRRYWLLLGFVYLLFNPYTYDYSSSPGVFRLGIYPALTLLVIACMIGVYTRMVQPDGRPLRWAVGLGISLAAFWYTREEGMWILPALLLAALFTVVHGITRGHRRWVVILGILLTPVAIWFSAYLSLGYMNWKHYGIFTDLDIKSSEFKAAYSALISVRSDRRERYVLLEAPVREAIAEVSPAFREIQPKLSCQQADCQFHAANFVWGLRDAVADAGYYDPKDAPATARFYQRLADEVNAACASGRLNCDRLFSSFLPPWQDSHTEAFPVTLRDTLRQVVYFLQSDPRMTPNWVSHGSPETITFFEYITGERARTAAALASIPSAHAGWSNFKTRRLMRIGRKYYQHAAPWPAVLALGAVVLSLLVGAFRKTISDATVVALVVLTGLLSHVFMLAVVGTMAFSAQRLFHPSVALSILFFVTGIVVLARTVGDIRNRVRPRNP